jgi:type I restriction enzyme S subunit
VSELPKGWAEVPIAEVCEVNPRFNKAAIDQSAPVSFIPMAAVAEESGRIDTLDHRSFKELAAKSYRGFLEGDVLVAKITPSMENGKGAVARGLAGGIGMGSTEFHVLRPSQAVEADYLLRFLLQQSFRREARMHMTGTAGQLRVPANFLANSKIPLPPISEQRRIVDAIEEYFTRIDAAEGSIRTCLVRAAKLQAAVLNAATKASWPEVPLGDLLISLRNGIFVSRPAPEPPGLPILRISAVRPMALDLADVRFAPSDTAKAATYCVEEGDLLFTRYSGNPDYVGACAVVPQTQGCILHPDKLIRGIVDRTRADPRYVAIALTARKGRQEIEGYLKTTAGQVGIAGSQLKMVHIPLPPLDEQVRLINYVESGMSQIGGLRTTIARQSHRATHLQRSILALAFSGRLVHQDASDEPADVLLDRIRATPTAPIDLNLRTSKATA